MNGIFLLQRQFYLKIKQKRKKNNIRNKQKDKNYHGFPLQHSIL